jgi:anaerobic selenocysteine-containing dehydrogenase
MTETKYTFCRICESLCGLKVKVENNEIVKIIPNSDHLATHGFGCVKGLHQHQIYQSPDRLKYPLKKVDGKHVRISWEQALSEIGQKVRQITGEFSKDSIAMYVGTAAGFGVLHPVFAQGFIEGIGSNSMYASATQDCSNKFATARHMYGFPFTQPFPDVLRNECLIIVGANPVISKWSFLQVPNPIKHIRDIKKRGGRVIVVDPRETETAKVAGEHIFIKPGSDVFFYLSFLHEVQLRQGIKYDHVQEYMSGLEEVLELASKWPADVTEKVTGISSDILKQLVDAYLSADGAALYSSTGVNMGGQGSLSFWIQEVINAVTGNLDRKGGTLVGRGIMDFIKFGVKNGLLMKDLKSRVGGFGTVNDAFPGGILADEILTPGKKQVRALFVTGGNPLITMADSEKLKTAFEKLDLLVCLDIQHNETCAVADYVLPCTDPFQRPDLPFIFPLMLGLQTKPYLQATKAVVPPQGEQRDEASIYIELAKASGFPLWGSKAAQVFFESLMKFNKLDNGQRAVPQQSMLNMLLKVCRQPGFKKLLKNPNGWLRADHKENDFLGKRVHTSDKKVALAPAVLMEAANARLQLLFDAESNTNGHFKMITKRTVQTQNSWTHNTDRMIRGSENTNFLYLNPEDAIHLKLKAGDLADVSSTHGKLRIPVKILAELMPGIVAIPHGWGHQDAKGMRVASKTKGVNVNILARSGVEAIDALSGMSKLTALEVVIEPAKGEQAHTWSGLPV